MHPDQHVRRSFLLSKPTKQVITEFNPYEDLTNWEDIPLQANWLDRHNALLVLASEMITKFFCCFKMIETTETARLQTGTVA